MNAIKSAKSTGESGQIAERSIGIHVVALTSEQRKHQATLVAKLALRGHVVYATHDGYLVCKHGFARHCKDLAALEAFGRQVGCWHEL